jgi:hypothetical protein
VNVSVFGRGLAMVSTSLLASDMSRCGVRCLT